MQYTGQFIKFAGIILFTVALLPLQAWGQDFSTSVTMGHDPNILESAISMPDQFYQWELSLSKDLDFNQFQLSASYDGSLQMYRDQQGRNFYQHSLVVSPSYIFGHSDDDDESSNDPPDSTTNNDDSSGVVNKIPPPPPPKVVPDYPPDSLDHVLYSAFFYSSRTDKDEFDQYDNAHPGGWLLYRFPISAKFNLRPSVGISSWNFENVDALSNTENFASLMLGAWNSSINWIEGGATIGEVNYLYSRTYYDSVRIGNPGHGKKGAGGGQLRVDSLTFSNPSVDQITWRIAVNKKFFNSTELKLGYAYFGPPSSEARVLPPQFTNSVGRSKELVSLTGVNEFYDDHYAYQGSAFTAHFDQPFLFDLLLQGDFEIQQKEFTSPALNLVDSVVAPRRLDHRFSGSFTLSKSFPVFINGKLIAHLVYSYLRNSSNADYFVFDKSVISFGLELTY
ncbi:MAG: hypothetical protein ACHQQQ_02590 [Bacteroidota bacterium]